jgi:hypothetical protein
LILNTGDTRRISGSATFMPPTTDLTCPIGQTGVLVCVEYARVRIEDTTTPIFTRLGTISRNFFPEDFPVCPPASTPTP